LARWIISMFPPHSCYVEPFAGSAAVFFAKDQVEVEVLNDINGDVMNFWAVLRDKQVDLISKLAFTPYSRKTYEQVLTHWKTGDKPTDPIKRAYEWFILSRQGFSGLIMSSWSRSKVQSQAKIWANATMHLMAAAERLSNVQLENRDFANVITSYDSDEALFYVDPPYIEADHDLYTGAVLSIETHRKLAELLNQIKGKAVVSFYPHELLEELYPHSKWHYVSRDIAKRSIRITEENSKRKRATELLLMNYKPTTNVLM
jgi:DNA adenine methylase